MLINTFSGVLGDLLLAPRVSLPQVNSAKHLVSCNTCMYVCAYVCMHARVYVRMYVCMYACMYVCMYVCMHVRM